MAGGTLSPAELNVLPAGQRVRDALGQIWTKQWNNLWTARLAGGNQLPAMTSDRLHDERGPITLVL